MTCRALARYLAVVAVVASLSSPALRAQENPSRFSFPLHADLGLPQGEFAENVRIAGGFGFGVLYAITRHVAVRADLGVMIYGSERRVYAVPVGPAGTINIGVTTTNAIINGGIGAQLGTPGPRRTPYLGAMLGFSNFTTSSSVDGSDNDDEPIEAKTNLTDNTLSKSLYAGFYFPIQGGSAWDIGVRYTWNGESVRYLTRGDIVDDGFGGVTLHPRETRADLLSIHIGFMLGGKRQ